jgi:hypothetical protein
MSTPKKYPRFAMAFLIILFLPFGLTAQSNGLMMNLNWTPMINTDEIWAVWFGLGIGYSWNN